MDSSSRFFILAFLILFLGKTVGYFESYSPADARRTTTLSIPTERVGHNYTPAEIDCLTRTIYNEARGEPVIGQVAVAAVIINRAKDSRWRATNLCEIVTAPKQFASGEPRSPKADELRTASRIARYVACNYHALEGLHDFYYFNSNKPRKGATMIGNHAFYT